MVNAIVTALENIEGLARDFAVNIKANNLGDAENDVSGIEGRARFAEATNNAQVKAGADDIKTRASDLRIIVRNLKKGIGDAESLKADLIAKASEIEYLARNLKPVAEQTEAGKAAA